MPSSPLAVSGIALATALSPAAGLAGTDPVQGWDLLRAIQTEEVETADDWFVTKIFPPQMRDGIAEFDLSGYAVPVTDGGQAREFILVSDLGFCPFCGDPSHGTALTVMLDDPIDTLEEGQRVTVRGALEPVRDPGTLMSAILRKGRILVD
ncbi:hypothetical protein ILP92_12400 [Maribius pontilimi]|uniref:DUF3299 domain-containing protein n=1 Tax=Palleronia pontilimi TaxID=1964209 RepID=A0A934MD64_9RHOB|nr:hypothetical protein [Palleronia pontilimi]MBJ3763548.1 hypothetical protein [Palleronia pontilimi]